MGGKERISLPLLHWLLVAVRAFLAGGCKVQFMLCQALNGLNPHCVRARLPPDDTCLVRLPARQQPRPRAEHRPFPGT